MKKKAQAASEFSIMSAFGIISIFIVVAGLWYFGIFSFVSAMPAKCVLPAGISCIDQSATQNKATFVLINNLGTDIIVDNVRMEKCSASGAKEIENNDMQKFELDCSLNAGGLKTSFYVDFRKKYTNMSQTWEGELLASVP